MFLNELHKALLIEEYKQCVQEIYSKNNNRLEMLKLELTFLGVLAGAIPALIISNDTFNFFYFAAPAVTLVFIGLIAQISNNQFYIMAAASYIHNHIRPAATSCDTFYPKGWESFLADLRKNRKHKLLAYDADYTIAIFSIWLLLTFQIYMITESFPKLLSFDAAFAWCLYVAFTIAALLTTLYLMNMIFHNRLQIKSLTTRNEDTLVTTDNVTNVYILRVLGVSKEQWHKIRPFLIGLVIAIILAFTKGIHDRSRNVDAVLVIKTLEHWRQYRVGRSGTPYEINDLLWLHVA